MTDRGWAPQLPGGRPGTLRLSCPSYSYCMDDRTGQCCRECQHLHGTLGSCALARVARQCTRSSSTVRRAGRVPPAIDQNSGSGQGADVAPGVSSRTLLDVWDPICGMLWRMPLFAPGCVGNMHGCTCVPKSFSFPSGNAFFHILCTVQGLWHDVLAPVLHVAPLLRDVLGTDACSTVCRVHGHSVPVPVDTPHIELSWAYHPPFVHLVRENIVPEEIRGVK